ncbi:MAG: hypothetical protein O3A95_03175 [Planctomycetota bacterium]|nr:hypothetical protein [Planctomycetota bacterium]MDA1113283.1 hypothetical protein [Planctomycetota bacterium]
MGATSSWSHDAADQLFTKTEEADWAVDILINNAGFGYYGGFLEQELDRVQAMLDPEVVKIPRTWATAIGQMLMKN